MQYTQYDVCMGLPLRLSGKESTCNAGDMGSILRSGRPPPGGENGKQLKCSCLENPRDTEVW